MDAKELIESGKLELYVCGALSDEELPEIQQAIASSPEVRAEIEAIEASLINLAKTVSPPVSDHISSSIQNSIRGGKSDKRTLSEINWAAISGWAAAILCIGGIFFVMNRSNDLRENIQITTNENNLLKEKIKSTEDVMTVLRSKDFTAYTLPGNQAVAPTAFAKVYFNNTDKIAYIDAKGLPEAPEGKVFQVWSLIMDPLTPSSVGLLESANEVDDGIYKFENIPNPEAFGITLEPSGGSDSPNLSQLFTLGMVSP